MNTILPDRENFKRSLTLDDFVEESKPIVKDYRCPLCEGIYLNPVVDSCGHVFCKGCITQYLESSSKCPFSGWQLEEKQVNPLYFVMDILERQTVLCKNRNFHCEWSGRLPELDPHLNVECKRQVVHCPHLGCENSVFREDLVAHTAGCDWRIVACSDCALLVAFIEVGPHQEVCPKFKVPCPQHCQHLIERQDIHNHIEDYCENTVIDCPYKDIGCFTRITKREVNDYLTANTNRHNLILISYFKGFTNEIMKKVESISEPRQCESSPMQVGTNLLEKVTALEHAVRRLETTMKENESNFNANNAINPINLSMTSKRLGKETPKRESPSSKSRNINSLNSPIELQEEDKFISRKRQRLDDDNPLNYSKNDVINLNDVVEEKENSPFAPEVSPVFMNVATAVNSEKKKEVSFDEVNLSRGLIVTGNKVVMGLSAKLEHRYAFANINLSGDQEVEWTVTFSVTSNWAAVGVCSKEAVVANRCKFITNSPAFNNATFAISTNGYAWNCTSTAENNLALPNFPHIAIGDQIVFTYHPEAKEVSYRIPNKMSGKLTSVAPQKNGSLVPCFIFLHSGDEMTLEQP